MILGAEWHRQWQLVLMVTAFTLIECRRDCGGKRWMVAVVPPCMGSITTHRVPRCFGASAHQKCCAPEVFSACAFGGRSANFFALEAQKIPKSASARQKIPDNSAPKLVLLYVNSDEFGVEQTVLRKNYFKLY
jgi:hypothetical protein